MNYYKVQLKRSAEKSLFKLPKVAIARLVQLLLKLESNPRPDGCKKLTGTNNSYRIRSGDYRIVYSIFDDVLIVDIIKIGHRKEIYRGLE